MCYYNVLCVIIIKNNAGYLDACDTFTHLSLFQRRGNQKQDGRRQAETHGRRDQGVEHLRQGHGAPAEVRGLGGIVGATRGIGAWWGRREGSGHCGTTRGLGTCLGTTRELGALWGLQWKLGALWELHGD